MDNCNYDNSSNICLSLYYTGECIIDCQKVHPEYFWGKIRKGSRT